MDSAQHFIHELQQLSQLISDGVATLKRACAEENLHKLPSLSDHVFDSGSEAFRAIPQVSETCKMMAAAAIQLAATVLPPFDSVFSLVCGPLKAAALRVALESNVTEVLRDAGPKGMHAKDIGRKANLDGKTISRLLRSLSTSHIYQEKEPDVFANNRISSVLDSQKSHTELVERRQSKYDQVSAFAAVIGHDLDEVFKSSAYLWEFLCSNDSNAKDSPFNTAFKEESSIWEWYEKPDNSHRWQRFGVAMKGAQSLIPIDDVLENALRWENLPKDSVVVDVGGGVGWVSLLLAQKHKNLKIVIQDRPSVVEDGFKLWQEKLPEALSSGRVSFQAHDFYKPQLIRNAFVFLLTRILHDYSDPSCVEILKQLRASAKPDTRLLILDMIAPYACQINPEERKGIPNAVMPAAPEPLLANGGEPQSGVAYMLDLLMLTTFGGQERTVFHMQELLQQTGWALKAVRRTGSGMFQPIVAAPI